jgi:hypothetical protein
MTRLKGSHGGILKVLLIIFGVLFLCVVLVGIYVGMHWGMDAVCQCGGIRRSAGLPDDQRKSCSIRQLGDDFKNGNAAPKNSAVSRKPSPTVR